MIDAQIEKAIRKRDTRAAEFLRDTVDGRPTTSDSQQSAAPQVHITIGADIEWLKPYCQPSADDTTIDVTAGDSAKQQPESDAGAPDAKKSDCGS